jgi:hypothetical protein
MRLIFFDKIAHLFDVDVVLLYKFLEHFGFFGVQFTYDVWEFGILVSHTGWIVQFAEMTFEVFYVLFNVGTFFNLKISCRSLKRSTNFTGNQSRTARIRLHWGLFFLVIIDTQT